MDPCPVLVGREQELAALRGILDAGGGVAIVSGEAGIGKSRLVREFAKEAEARGRIVLWARPEEVAQPGPYALIVDLLESIAERGSAIRDDARALAAELMPADLKERRPTPATRTAAAELRGLLSRVGLPLVALEDLHRADESSHAVVLHLARAATDDGHLVVATLRGEGLGASPSLARLLANISQERIAEKIHLDPLAASATAEMLSALWGRRPTEDEIAAFTRLGEGVPFFIEELAASEDPMAAGRIPRTVAQTVVARLMALGPDASRVLRIASLTLGTIDREVLAAATGYPVSEVARHLIAAAREGLIVDREGNLTFRHALVRETIASELVSVEAMQAHAEIARAIERIHAGDLERFATALALHYQSSGEPEPAIRYSLISGERSLAFAATDEARTSFQQALQLSGEKSTQALIGIAEADFREGREEEAGRLFRSAADALKNGGDQIAAARALGRLAWTRMGRSAVSEALGPLDEALRLLAHIPNSEEYVRLMIQKGNALLFAFGRIREATPLLEGARSAAERLGNERLLAEALDGLAYAAQRNSSWKVAAELGRRGCDAAIKSEDAEAIGRTHTNHAVVLAVTGEPVAALDVLLEARDKLQRTHGRAGVGALDVTHAWVARLLGRPKETAALVARSHAAWQRWRGYRRIVEVWSALERGELALARSAIETFWQEIGSDQQRAILEDPQHASSEAGQALHCESLLLLNEGDPQKAVRSARGLVNADRHHNEAFDLGLSLSILGRALIEVGDLEDASDVLKELEELGEQYPYHRAAAHEIAGLTAQASGNGDLSTSEFQAASEGFARCSNESDRARCERRWADTIAEQGPEFRPEAVEILRRALKLAEQAGAVGEQNRIESALRAHGIRPRAGRPRRSQSSQEIGGLSPREAEVAVLVAAGVTNADIGRQLFLSERTIQDHIGHALRKLGLTGRAALASWAVRQGMI